MAVNYDKYFQLVKKKGITTNQILKEAEISANILTRMKRNEYISLQSIEKICKVMKCSVSDILEITFDD